MHPFIEGFLFGIDENPRPHKPGRFIQHAGPDISHLGPEDDRKVLESDWQIVGQDLQGAMDRHQNDPP